MALSTLSACAMHDNMLGLRSPTLFFSKYYGGRTEICFPSNITHKQPLFNPLSLCKQLPCTRSLQMNHMMNSVPRIAGQCYSLEKSSFAVGKKFQLDDVIEAQQFDRDILNEIFQVAREMELIEKNSSRSQILRGFLMATLFYEPSTRTRLSFESAMKRLGGEVLTTENAREFSSAAKGETLEGYFSQLHRLEFSLLVNLFPLSFDD